jgi:hypothetical protein
MTFKDLKKRVSLEITQDQSELFGRLQDKPFWIWDIDEHKQEDKRTNGDCCFNHIIGVSPKNGINKPLYDYEKIIFDFLVAADSSKHLWIKKATGLWISEFMLRFMAWFSLKDNALAGSQMCIVTGPRIDLAIALIDRRRACSEAKVFLYLRRQYNLKAGLSCMRIYNQVLEVGLVYFSIIDLC